MSFWRTRGGAAAIAAVLLGGCAGGAGLGTSGAGLAGADTLGQLNSAPVIALTATGLGAVGADTPYSQKALANALPGFSFQTVKTMSEGHLKWLLGAFSGGLQQAQFEGGGTGGTIRRIHLVGQEAAGPNGERIGMTYGESGGSKLSCTPGRGEWSRMALCINEAHSLTYIYAPDDYDWPEGRLPDAARLARARLVRMIWEAPAG
ncbi:MAG: DUF1131 family protein [Rhodobiaceae bacterium]|nr:DUF1131 family protein [Rhodobiaceae bacterium]